MMQRLRLKRHQKSREAAPQGAVGVNCHVSGKLVSYMKNNKEVVLHSYGVCRECKLVTIEEELHFAPGVEPSRYPVVYEGVPCSACYEKEN